MLYKILNTKPFILIRNIREKKFLNSLRLQNKNINPTIVANNCIAGIIYHNLGLKFASPTINLFFKEDFVKFAKDFEYYSKCDIVETKIGGVEYPVGRLVPNDDMHDEIIVHFRHYKTFEQAKSKWIERYNRVNYDNIFFIYEFYDDIYDEKLVYEFEEIPYKKVILTHKKIDGLKNDFVLTCYKENKPVAKVFRYKGLSGKRYLDEFDYVSFLNNSN